MGFFDDLESRFQEEIDAFKTKTAISIEDHLKTQVVREGVKLANTVTGGHGDVIKAQDAAAATSVAATVPARAVAIAKQYPVPLLVAVAGIGAWLLIGRKKK